MIARAALRDAVAMITTPSKHPRVAAFDQFVRGGDHPCAMARSVLQRQTARYGSYAALGTASSVRELCADLYTALAEPRPAGANWSFVAFFDGSPFDDEESFEQALWQQLQAMHDADFASYDWDRSVSSDPENAKFSFSLGGQAWYVIGLHPGASRLARRFGSVALVFNPHQQFERLRADGRYDRIKGAVRERDIALQGSVNPVLTDHGDASEARQYSGRAVPADWKCPFHRH